MRSFQAHDHAQLPAVHDGVEVSRPLQGRVGDKPVRHMIGRNRPLPVKAARVLRNQHEAGIRPIVNALRPGVAHAPAHVVGQALVEVDQQSIPLRIPLGISFEVDTEGEGSDVGDNAKQRTGKAIRRIGGTRRAAIVIFGSRVPMRIVDGVRGGLRSRVVELISVRLVHIVETSQVYPAHVHSGNAQDGVLERLDFKTQAGLRSVGRLVILDEANNDRLQRTCRIICNGLTGMEQRVQRGGIGERVSAKGRQPRIRVQIVLDIFSSWIFRQASARGNLAHEQGRRNLSVEEPGATTNHEAAVPARRVRESGARIEVLQRIVERR